MKLALAVLALATSAAAEPLPQPAGSPQFALAVNSPLSWALHDNNGPLAVAGSGYVSLDRHQMLRLNVARYQLGGYGDVLPILLSGEGSDCNTTGVAYDAGAGWMYFPRERFRGLSLEGGMLVRTQWKDKCVTDIPFVSVKTTSTIVAARALVGWSWLLGDHVYLSIAAGASLGYEHGTAVTHGDRTGMANVSRADLAPEIFARIGWAFL